MRTPDAASIAAKWARVTPTRQQDYQTGVQGAANAWQEGVNGAQDSWAQGVATAAANGSYSSGVQGRGQFYAAQASGVGPGRWAQGVQASSSRYQSGVSRPLAALSSLTLPPRGPKGAPQNMQRVQVVVDALRASRL